MGRWNYSIQEDSIRSLAEKRAEGGGRRRWFPAGRPWPRCRPGMGLGRWALGLVLGLGLLGAGCSEAKLGDKAQAPDRTVVASSQYPTAVEPSRVGAYPSLAKSGAGYFYDDVLEYRVWIHPREGGDDYFRAFASYEPALQFSKQTAGAEEPLVLVRQHQWVNEPEPGKFEPRSDERIAEWQVPWLRDHKRTEGSIEQFLKEKVKAAK